MGFFHPLMTLLRLNGKRCDGTGLQPRQAYGFVGFRTKPIGPVFNTLQRFVDFGRELAGAVAGAQFQGPIRFNRRPVAKIRFLISAFLQMLDGVVGFAQ